MPTQRKDQAVPQKNRKPATASGAQGTASRRPAAKSEAASATPRGPKPAAKARKRPSRSGRARAPQRDKSVARASATSVVVAAPTSEATPQGRGGVGTQNSPSLEQVSRRAYEIYLSRGQEPGDAFTDWMRACAELENAAN